MGHWRVRSHGMNTRIHRSLQNLPMNRRIGRHAHPMNHPKIHRNARLSSRSSVRSRFPKIPPSYPRNCRSPTCNSLPMNPLTIHPRSHNMRIVERPAHHECGLPSDATARRAFHPKSLHRMSRRKPNSTHRSSRHLTHRWSRIRHYRGHGSNRCSLRLNHRSNRILRPQKSWSRKPSPKTMKQKGMT